MTSEGNGHQSKDLASGTQRTEGGGEPRPIRGTFSYRGFPPNRAVWFLGERERAREERLVRRPAERAEGLRAAALPPPTHMYSDRGALETAGAGGWRLFWLPMLLL